MPGNGEIKSNETLVEIITEIIFKATVEHAAFSLPIYDEAAFVPNYPLAMRGIPPISKVKHKIFNKSYFSDKL